jgi:hypothetical protein
MVQRPLTFVKSSAVLVLEVSAKPDQLRLGMEVTLPLTGLAAPGSLVDGETQPPPDTRGAWADMYLLKAARALATTAGSCVLALRVAAGCPADATTRKPKTPNTAVKEPASSLFTGSPISAQRRIFLAVPRFMVTSGGRPVTAVSRSFRLQT